MKTSQSFPFYPSDFIFGTMMMTPAQVGGYIRGLCYQWESGGFPTGLQEQKIITGCGEEDLAVIVRKFEQEGSVLVNRRLEDVRLDREHYIEVQRLNGKKGGRPKKKATENPSLTQPQTQTEAKKSLPSPFPSPNTPKPPEGAGADPRHHEIASRIKAEYKAATGQDMPFDGKDAKDLSKFLSSWSGTSAQFFDVAKRAWKRSREPFASATKSSHTLSGLCKRWGEIVAESQEPKPQERTY